MKLDELIEAAIACGDCYKAAGRLVAFEDHNLTLVHGTVTGQARLEGIKYGHAWAEDKSGHVYDHSNGRENKMDKERYYRAYKIQEKSLTKYTSDEVVHKLADTHHWGPWD